MYETTKKLGFFVVLNLLSLLISSFLFPEWGHKALSDEKALISCGNKKITGSAWLARFGKYAAKANFKFV